MAKRNTYKLGKLYEFFAKAAYARTEQCDLLGCPQLYKMSAAGNKDGIEDAIFKKLHTERVVGAHRVR
jgi:hypothetical protein